VGLGGCLAPCRELRRFSGAQQEKGPLRGFSPPQFLPSSRAEGHRLFEGGKQGVLVSNYSECEARRHSKCYGLRGVLVSDQSERE
jgi:hypothetical protein